MTLIGKITVFHIFIFSCVLVCDKSCDGCDGPSNGDCKQCNPGFKLNNTKCSRKYLFLLVLLAPDCSKLTPNGHNCTNIGMIHV